MSIPSTTRPQCRCGLALVFLVLIFITGCRQIPDSQLKATFVSNRPQFEKLASMADADASSALQTEMSKGRLRSYQDVVKPLGIKHGVGRRPEFPNAMFFYALCQGNVLSRDCKGYAYSRTPLSPIEKDVDDLTPGVHLARLSGQWYLFRDED